MRNVLRVGTVPYLVGRPLDLGLEAEPGIAVVQAVPAELVERLRRGEIDVALVSSVELFRRPGYSYLEGLAVQGRGRVGSVQVFLGRPLSEIQSVALDPSSRAAAALVRVLLDPASPRFALGGVLARAPEFVEVPPGGDPREAGCDAWLRIGDQALRESFARGAPPRFDPCAAWTERTGLPFAFAAWVVRPGAEIEPALGAFARARARGRASVDRVAEQAARAWGLPAEACRRYLREECRFDAGPELETSLLAFRDAAAALGLCRGDLTPAVIRTAAEHVP